jgi:hypothetical protein
MYKFKHHFKDNEKEKGQVTPSSLVISLKRRQHGGIYVLTMNFVYFGETAVHKFYVLYPFVPYRKWRVITNKLHCVNMLCQFSTKS